MSTHTPGPWNFRRVNNVDHYRCVPTDTNDREILKAVPIDRIAEVEANARLVIAAPAMLEALKLAHFALLSIPDDVKAHLPGNVLPALQQAIRLAEGRG